MQVYIEIVSACHAELVSASHVKEIPKQVRNDMTRRSIRRSG